MLGLLIRSSLMVFMKVAETLSFVGTAHHYFQKIKRCPPIKDQIIYYPAHVLADKIRKRELTSETIVRTYINRIKEVNPILNAVVEDRFELAVKEAMEIDKMLETTHLTVDELKERYPLLGLPLTVKESIAVAGMSHCAGRVFPDGKKAVKDAESVRLCKEAGAVVVAVTNTPELCVHFETSNLITGKTCNPYDTRRTPGGSSGGEAALLGAGASVIGLGSDIYGSVRLPAHYCGIWGHKPSSDVVSVDGHFPSCKQEKEWNEVFNIGPMCRYASDLSLLMRVLLKSNYAPLVELDKKDHLSDIKLYYMEDNAGSILTNSVDKDILDALRRVVMHMQSKYGCKVEKININEFKYSFEISMIKLCKLNDVEVLFDNNGEASYKELLRFLLFQSRSSLPSIVTAMAKNMWQYVPEKVPRHFGELEERFKTKLFQTLGSDGVLIYPCHTTTAPIHNRCLTRVFDYSYVGIFNSFGLPATSCPIGLTSEGLPFGIQVAAGSKNDRLTLAIAEEIEKEFGGWIPPQFRTTS